MSSEFSTVQKKNKENEERLRRERQLANQGVLKSYRISPKKDKQEEVKNEPTTNTTANADAKANARILPFPRAFPIRAIEIPNGATGESGVSIEGSEQDSAGG